MAIRIKHAHSEPELAKQYFAGIGMPIPTPEYQFAKPRKFAFDFAWPEQKLALEVEGGVFGKGKRCPVCKRRAPGAHGSISGIKRDIDKYNLAASLGWRVFRCLPEKFESEEVAAMIRQALEDM